MPRVEAAVGQTALERRGRPPVRVWYPTDALKSRSSSLRHAWAGLRRSLWGGGLDCAPFGRSLRAGTEHFPVVVYFSGWPGTEVDNCALITALAAHGFVVAVPLYTDRTPMDYSSAAALRRTVELANRRVAERAHDAVDLLDELYGQQAHDPDALFAQRLDPYRAGIMGFSFGGAIAAEAAALDARIRAVINIDGRHWGNALERGVTQPYLFIGEELVVPGTADFTAQDADRRHNAALDLHDYAQLAANLRRNGGTQIVIRDTLHMNFCDGALRGRWRRRRDLGPIAPARALRILNTHVITFFEQHLLRPDPGRQAPAEPVFPETRIERWPPP